MNYYLQEIINFINENNDLEEDDLLNYIRDFDLTQEEKKYILSVFKANYNNHYSYTANDQVTDYLNEISKYKLLTQDELVELSIRKDNGDKEARDLIIKSNLKFVVIIAKRYINSGIDFMEIINEGNMGLIKAVDKFDYSLGYKFTTYAYYWIRQSINRMLDKRKNILKIPYSMKVQMRKLKQYENELIQELKRYPTDLELKDYYNLKNPFDIIDESKIRECFDNLMDPIYLNSRIKTKDNEETEMLEFIKDDLNIENEIDNKLFYETLNKLFEEGYISNLTEQEKIVLKYHFGIGGRQLSLSEIGKMFNVTKERIRQIELKALRKLRRSEKGLKLIDGYKI